MNCGERGGLEKGIRKKNKHADRPTNNRVKQEII